MWRKEAGFSFFRPFPAFPNPRICDILYPIGSVLTGERGMTEMAKPEAPVLETERLRLRRRPHRDIPRMMQMCACIDAANTRSVRLAERLGFERIAFLPEADFGGRVADMYYYARKLPGREWPLVP